MTKPGHNLSIGQPANPSEGVREEPSSLDKFLGPPPVLDGESAEDYRLLLTRVSDAVRPTDVIEEIWVREVADIIWENIRLRRIKLKVVDASSYLGLKGLLAPLVPGWPDERDQLAEEWARRERGALSRVKNVLAQAGLDQENIMAETFTVKLDDIERIDRMIIQNENRRNVALREIDRRRDTAAARIRELIEEVEFEEMPSDAGKNK